MINLHKLLHIIRQKILYYYIAIVRNSHTSSSTRNAHVVAKLAAHLVIHVLQSERR